MVAPMPLPRHHAQRVRHVVSERLRRLLERKPNTDANRFVRDMIVHDARALFRPTPDASIRAIGTRPETTLQTSVD